MSLLAELKRRNVFRVAMAWLALGWVVTQVAGTMAPYLRLPEWTVPMVIMIGVIGFPCVLIFSWVYELTPEGLKRESEIDRSQSITPHTGRRLDYVIVGLLVAAIAMFALDRFAPSTSVGGGLAPDKTLEAGTSAVEASRGQGPLPPLSPTATPAPDEKSIAVLPFVNMSSDKEQDYFSDGLSEELLNLLAKVPQLTVIARTSSFAFKGQNLEIPEIARRLAVANILEGSVRKSGSKLRITAQLVEAASGKHLWSETYDRELADVFVIQDEIAGAVVGQLKLALLGEPPRSHEIDPRAYALFLQGREVSRQYTAEAYEQSNELFKQAVAIEPRYAEAWRGLTVNYANQVDDGIRSVEQNRALAREAIENAIAADPDYASAIVTRGVLAYQFDLDIAAAVRDVQRGLEMDPGDIAVLANSANFAVYLGRFEQGAAIGEAIVARDPINAVANYNLGAAYLGAGRTDDAMRAFRTTLSLSPGALGPHFIIGMALLLKGDAEAALLEAQQEPDEVRRLCGIAVSQHSLGHAAEADAALAEMKQKFGGTQRTYIAGVLAWRGDRDGAFRWLDEAVTAREPGSGELLSRTVLLASLHEDPRWDALLRRLGLTPEQLAEVKFEVKPS